MHFAALAADHLTTFRRLVLCYPSVRTSLLRVFLQITRRTLIRAANLVCFLLKLILVVSNNFFQILVVIEVKKPVCEIQWLRDPDLQAGDSASDKIFNAVCWHKKCNTTVSGSFVYSVDSDYKYRLNDYFILNSFKYVSYPFSVGLSPAAKLYLQTFFLKTYIITLRYP